MSTATRAPEATATAEETAAGGGRKKLLIIVVVLLLAAGAAYWFVLRSPGAAPPPKPGDVVALDPLQVNLDDGHYLSIGIALQTVEGTKEIDGSKALDAMIALFSGKKIDELIKSENREDLKKELGHQLEKLYEDEVMGVYFTQFVTQ